MGLYCQLCGLPERHPGPGDCIHSLKHQLERANQRATAAQEEAGRLRLRQAGLAEETNPGAKAKRL